MPETIYINVTDLALHAAKNANVTGIQRVSLSVLGALSDHGQREWLKLVFIPPDSRDLIEIDFADVFRPDEVMSLPLFAARLGLNRGNACLPAVQIVRDSLRYLEHRKFRRSLTKAAIYAAYMAGMPFARRRYGVAVRSGERVRFRRLRALPEGAVLLSLGSPWGVDSSISLARTHAASGGRVLQLVHDLIPHVAPQFCREATRSNFCSWLASALDYTSEFVCVSENTRKDFFAFADIKRPGVAVRARTVPLAHEFEGYKRVTEAGSSTAPPAGLASGAYLLCVGTIEARKNPMGLLEAWSRIGGPMGRVDTLVFAGRPGWLVDDFFKRLESTPYLRRSVKILPSVNDGEMAELYRHCAATIYPSHYEGWGLPVGESAWFGKFCLTSRVSSLPEVLGPAAGYLDQNDIDDMAQKIRVCLSDARTLMDKERTIRSLPLRTWREVAAEILMVCSKRPAAVAASCNQ